jgi:cell division septation protein DedD
MQHEFRLHEEDGSTRHAMPGRRRNWAFGGQADAAADDAGMMGSTAAGMDAEPDIPPLPPGVAPLTVGPEDGAAAAVGSRSFLRPRLYFGVLLVALAGVGTWILGGDAGDEPAEEVPLILAEEGPEKVRPAEEGGLEVPNQNVLIYEQLDGEGQAPVTELLLPEPEAPLAPPPPEIQFGADEAVTAPAAVEPPIDEGAEVAAVEEDVDIPMVAAPSLELAPAAGVEEDAFAGEASELAAAEEPETQTAALAGAFRIQLAAVKSEDAARSAWTKLSKLHGDQLGGLSLRVEPVDRGAEGMLYRIQAGPIADRAAAQDVCAQLKKKDQPCLVVAP